MSDLVLGPGFKIDANIATKRGVLIGQPEAGKTNGLTVIAEELLKIGVPIAALDWKGDLWGVRSSADGKRDGFPVVIFGGDHADVEITEQDGREIGSLVGRESMPALIDLSGFLTDVARRRFATAFVRAFLQVKKDHREVHPALIDEFQQFAPQNPRGDGIALLAATEALVGLGRKRGIGVIGTALRAAQLNKNVVEISDVLFMMQQSGRNDLAAVEATLATIAPTDDIKRIKRTIPGLGKGEVVVYSPAWLRVLEEKRFRRRETFDSSQTPQVGSQVVSGPRVFAKVDVPALAARIAAQREQRMHDDPDALREQIASLQARLAERSGKVETITETVTVETSVLSEADLVVMREVVSRADSVIDLQRNLEASVETVRESIDRMRDTIAPVASALGLQRTFDALMAGVRPAAPLSVTDSAPRVLETSVREAVQAVSSTAEPAPTSGLGSGHMRVLQALAARHPAPSTRVQTAVLAGYAASGGGFANYLGKLRTLGFVTYPEPNMIALTDEGAALVRDHVPKHPPTSAELLEMWGPRVGSARRVFEAITSVYPRSIARERVAEVVGMSVSGGGFANYLGKLRGLGLIEYPSSGVVRASDALYPDRRGA